MEQYSDEDLIWLSGIQKFLYCSRQWGLRCVEDQWADNHLTVDGNYVHRRVHDADLHEKRNNMITARGMPVRSYTLGISGKCDAVEFIEAPEGAYLQRYGKTYAVIPVEYKHGHEKADKIDLAQVAAQAICLEEMLCCHIDTVALYYAETHSRKEYMLTDELRELVASTYKQMHDWLKRGYVPKPKMSKKCDNCSLKGLCLPELSKANAPKKYIMEMVKEEESCEDC